MKRIYRKVVSHWTYSPTNNPHPGYDCSLVLVLGCGHESGRKRSMGIPRKALCQQCEDEQYQEQIRSLKK